MLLEVAMLTSVNDAKIDLVLKAGSKFTLIISLGGI